MNSLDYLSVALPIAVLAAGWCLWMWGEARGAKGAGRNADDKRIVFHGKSPE